MRNRLFVSAAAVAALAGSASAQNMLANPSFDDAGGSLTGWTAFGNAFVDTAIFNSGPASAKLFGNFSGGFDVTGIFQAFPAAAGETYTIDMDSFVGSFDPLLGAGPPNDNWAVMKIAFFDAPAGGTEIGAAEAIIADGTTPQDVWIDNAPVSGTAPAGTQRVEAFVLFLQPFNDGGSVFVDNASFIPAPGAVALLGMGGLMAARRRR